MFEGRSQFLVRHHNSFAVKKQEQFAVREGAVVFQYVGEHIQFVVLLLPRQELGCWNLPANCGPRCQNLRLKSYGASVSSYADWLWPASAVERPVDGRQGGGSGELR